MRVLLAGQSRFAALAFAALNAIPRVSVVEAATPRAAAGDSFDKVLAAHPDLPRCFTEDLRRVADARERIAFDRIDLLVLANCPTLIPAEVLSRPLWGSLCFHPSLLPRHRGIDAVRWTLRMGDTETGVTIFRPDAGMDTGPILTQRACPIPPGIEAGPLYHEHLVPLGIAALCEAVEALRDGTATETPQDEALATYEPPIREVA